MEALKIIWKILRAPFISPGQIIQDFKDYSLVAQRAAASKVYRQAFWKTLGTAAKEQPKQVFFGVIGFFGLPVGIWALLTFFRDAFIGYLGFLRGFILVVGGLFLLGAFRTTMEQLRVEAYRADRDGYDAYIDDLEAQKKQKANADSSATDSSAEPKPEPSNPPDPPEPPPKSAPAEPSATPSTPSSSTSQATKSSPDTDSSTPSAEPKPETDYDEDPEDAEYRRILEGRDFDAIIDSYEVDDTYESENDDEEA